MKYVIYILFIGITLSSCNKDDEQDLVDNDEYMLDVPAYFGAYTIPADNPLTKSKVRLGEKLFNEVKLSKDNSISCASCHQEAYGFADVLAFSKGANGAIGERNSPTIINMLWSPYFMLDGGPTSLENQAVLPFENHLEFNIHRQDVVERLNRNVEYLAMFQAAFEEGPNPKNITYALASYVRTLVRANSRFDQYQYHADERSMTPFELEGMRLFMGDKLQCNSCHQAPLMTNFSFANNGLYEPGGDVGRYGVTLIQNDLGKFKVPTLRDIAITAPYMHDGRFATLEEVIEHYNNGGIHSETKDQRIRELGLTDHEKQALQAFLLTLTSDEQLD